MKKFIIAVACLVFLYLAWDTAYYRLGWHIDLNPDQPVSVISHAEGKSIYVDGEGEEPFIVKGVNMGSGIPGQWATDYAIDEETYLRWFEMIQDMGANTIRVYTILNDDFYNAFYKYNHDNEHPLYLIHGVWVNDYVQNSHRDAFDDDFRGQLIEDCRTLVDLLHGRKKLSLGNDVGSGSYRKDISQWVIGYIVGVEWEDVTVAYTDHKFEGMEPYRGTYLSASSEASPFESMLAEVGDLMIQYETQKYKQQKLIAFSNWPTTDPFRYPEKLTAYFMKCGYVDVENIECEEDFLAGQFVSYHVYPYYPDYLGYLIDDSRLQNLDIEEDARLRREITEGVPIEDVLGEDLLDHLYDEKGNANSYAAYLKLLTTYHTMPVVISEFGVSTGRGMAQIDRYTGRNQGHMSEQEQGEALISCWEDIMSAGACGGCVFSWQDEWFKRTWNTMHAVDLTKTPYWSDYQTNEQYFGLLSFDPGEETSICYIDGDVEEWETETPVAASDAGQLYMKYDEKFIYLLIKRENYDPEDRLYIPIDLTPKTGSTECENYEIGFEREADFLIVIDGEENSRVLVQERYEVLRAMYYENTDGEDPYVNPPDPDTPVFKEIDLILQTATSLTTGLKDARAETYETGKLEHGNSNPESEDYNSLADFNINGDYIEVRIPWQLLNFSNPSEMEIHDDYYEHYGIETISVDQLYIGIGDEGATGTPIAMESFALEGWGKSVTYHERLKPSYYILQKEWREE